MALALPVETPTPIQPEGQPEAGAFVGTGQVPGTISVAIVDDESDLRQSITTFVNGSPGIRCVSGYGSAEAALKGIPLDRPDVVLMDIHMDRMDGIECVRRLKEMMPHLQIVMLTVYEDTEQIFRALAAGASGYLLKRVTPTRLLEAIRDVHAGGSPMSSSIARKVVASFQKAGPSADKNALLSPREQTVLECLAKGLPDKQIADQVGIGVTSIRAHLRSIYDKLHVQSRSEAIAKFIRGS